MFGGRILMEYRNKAQLGELYYLIQKDDKKFKNCLIF